MQVSAAGWSVVVVLVGGSVEAKAGSIAFDFDSDCWSNQGTRTLDQIVYYVPNWWDAGMGRSTDKYMARVATDVQLLL